MSEQNWLGKNVPTPLDLAEMARKVRIAKEAREFAKALRAGKSPGFRKQVGR